MKAVHPHNVSVFSVIGLEMFKRLLNWRVNRVIKCLKPPQNSSVEATNWQTFPTNAFTELWAGDGYCSRAAAVIQALLRSPFTPLFNTTVHARVLCLFLRLFNRTGHVAKAAELTMGTGQFSTVGLLAVRLTVTFLHICFHRDWKSLFQKISIKRTVHAGDALEDTNFKQGLSNSKPGCRVSAIHFFVK